MVTISINIFLLLISKTFFIHTLISLAMDDDRICLFLDTINHKILCMINEVNKCIERPIYAYSQVGVFERASRSKEKIHDKKKRMSIVSLQSNWMNNIGMYHKNAPR